MKIFSTINNNNISNSCSYFNKRTQYYNTNIPDTFEKQDQNINFTGRRVKIKTKTIEELYQNLEGVHDPYSDVLLLPKKKLKEFKRKAETRTNCNSMLGLLRKYQEHFFEPERKIFEIFEKQNKETQKKSPQKLKDLDFHKILQSLLPKAKEDLKNQQYNIIDGIEKISREMSEPSYAKIQDLCTKFREKINDNSFRNQESIKKIKELRDEIPESKILENIIELSEYLPNSTNNHNVFIVKNAHRSHEEIAIALIKPALSSVEHIRPRSKHGASSPNNYMAASTRMNNLRKSMSLPSFIKRYPKIPEQTQRYFDDIIVKINRGGLHQIAGSLPYLQEQLRYESKDLININFHKIHNNVFLGDQQVLISKIKELMNIFN